ncbi:MAG: sugar phosphate isomerase/epimerase [Caldilineaceae bacterium]|nr:sugar phosphate isomerase/epimerase [Caldilineaceae bacterium]
MHLIVFSKLLKEYSVPKLIALAHSHGYDGYDLCVRPGYAVSPEDAGETLPAAVAQMAVEGVAVLLVTGPTSLTDPRQPEAESLLAALATSGVPRLKVGYFRFDRSRSYQEQVDSARRTLENWEILGRIYGVQICYHTHSGSYLGLNAASLLHLLRDRDPAYIGAYLDPGHLAVNGEPFDQALAMTRDYLSVLSLKDVQVERVEAGAHGKGRVRWLPAGQGIVDWTSVFADLNAADFEGPASIHCEYEVPAEGWAETFGREIASFRRWNAGSKADPEQSSQ